MTDLMTTVLATRHESKTVRPFVGVGAVATVMDRVQLSVDGDDHSPGTIVLADEELDRADLRLKLPDFDSLRAAVEQNGRAHVDCAFLILARSHTHRISHPLYHEVLRKADLPAEYPLDRNDPDNNLILNDREGFSLVVAVYLIRDLHPEPLQPHKVGTWLAKADFKVNREKSYSSFSPLPLTAELRKELELPSQTPSFVEVKDNLLEAEPVSEAVTVYYDDALLSILHANPKDPLVQQAQRELAAQTMTVIAQTAVARIRADKSGVPASPEDLDQYPGVKSFFQSLATQQGTALATVLSRAEEADRLRAHISAAMNLRDATLAALNTTGDAE